MRELYTATPKSMSSQTGQNDILAQVLCPARRNRIRLLGFCATLSNASGSSSFSGTPRYFELQ